MATPGNESPSWVQLALRLGIFSLRQRSSRRKLMFYISLAAMAQLVLGIMILDWLSQSVILFILFWAFCACLVCLMLLMSLYDILAVRQEQQAELVRLRAQVFSETDSEDSSTHADDSRDSGDA